jgi:guanylate kinase
MNGGTDSMGKHGLVICVSGPSGVGKGTVIGKILDMRPQMAHSISVTTRPPRPGETEGVEYFFKSQDEFEVMRKDGGILESDCYCGNFYGTPRRNLENLVSQGIDVLLDITVPGSLTIMSTYPEAVNIFLLPPSFSELARRLAKRGTENPAEQAARLAKAHDEITKAGLFRYCIVNDDLADTARIILAIADAEHCRYDRRPGLEKTILSR